MQPAGMQAIEAAQPNGRRAKADAPQSGLTGRLWSELESDIKAKTTYDTLDETKFVGGRIFESIMLDP